MSAFHLGFTVNDTMTSKLALALNQAMHGDFGGSLKSLAEVPISGVLTPLRGRKMVNEFLNPGSQGEEMGRIVDAALHGGWRGTQDSHYATQMSKKMMSALRSGTIGGLAEGALRAPFAAIEQVSRPIMEKIVPWMKAGVAHDLIRMEMARNPDMTKEQLRSVADKVARSVDNRLGQLVYNNLHWSKGLKGFLQAFTRSVGWNVGTFREIVGGALDLRKLISTKPELTYRAAYVLAMAAMSATVGAAMQKMMTGQFPQELKDWFFPRTGTKDAQGRDQRVSLPSYVKDVYAYGHDPKSTVTHKLHPLLSTIAELMENKDFYGTEIRNPKDNLLKQAGEVAAHAGKAFVPFGFRGLQQMHASGDSVPMQVAPFIGITPAPASIKKTAAENLASDFMHANMPGGARTQEQAETSQNKAAALRAMRNGDFTTPAKMLGDGTLQPKDFARLAKQSAESPLESAFKHLNLDQALAVYAKGTPSERNRLLPLLVKKQATAAKAGTFPARSQ
jgi:hypothetical protein